MYSLCKLCTFPIFSSFHYNMLHISWLSFLTSRILVINLTPIKLFSKKNTWLLVVSRERVINFLTSHNNTNSQSTEQQCDEKKENHQTRGYHLIEHHILKDIFMTLVWQTVKRIDFNILEVKGLVPLRQPMVLFLPELFLNWSLLVPIDFVTWYVFTVDHPDITITDWQRVL